ncbi:MAG: prepilin peptidase [Clostridia bacterium]|nr:prepilin peptidase [Clostridia bacterium]
MELVFFLTGTFTGSFLNVCIYRIPKGQSVAWPGSYCPSCRQPLAWYQLIPVVSYFLLKGRCSCCSTPVSWRYPLVEVVTGLLFLYTYRLYGLSPAFTTLAFLGSLLLVISLIDSDYRIIPNGLVLIGLGVGLVQNLLFSHLNWEQVFFGFLAGGGILLLIAFLSRGGMGGGDIKLGAMLGVYVGWPGILGTLVIASVTGAIYGLTAMAWGKKSLRDSMPFGPFLALGALVVLFWGPQLWAWYAGFFL